MTCDNCKAETARLTSIGNLTWVCKGCVPQRASDGRYFRVSETVWVEGEKTTKAQIDELCRRVVLPDHKADGGYYLGRRGENGKVQDREPTY